MPEFLNLLPPGQALSRLLDKLPVQTSQEMVDTTQALGRVTVSPVLAPHPLPSFPRTSVDGYALRASDTYGAGDALPAYLKLIGEVPMGAAPDLHIKLAQCALIHTGGMLPDGADAVVMLEYTQILPSGDIEISRAAAIGENIIRIGEDVAQGQPVIPAGKRLRPAEIGGLMALGITQILVAPQPRVGILSSGDEVIPPARELTPGCVRDVNSYSLGALVEENGGIPQYYGIVPDRAEALREKAAIALHECDLVVITAGSSASSRDLTSQVVQELGQPGVLVHGVNVKPGKPTILAVCNGKAIIGLPGNPVSALVIARLFVAPVIHKCLGLNQEPIEASVRALLSFNLASLAGREDWVAVRLEPHPDGYRAEPVLGQSNLIFILSRADGLVHIPPDVTGLEAGSMVEVVLL
jgi:molybdopterin molybdotransferase